MAGDPWGDDPIVSPAPAPRGRSARPVAADPWGDDPIVAPAGASPSSAPAGPLRASGQAHDGDTFRLTDGRNARLLGVDAFELNQSGRSAAGQLVPLGLSARAALGPYATPQATVTPTGAQTYGRPVATLDNGGDAGRALIDQGFGLSAPQYLHGDLSRLRDYTQAERLARQNRRGAHATTYATPGAYRQGKGEPWATPEAGTRGNSADAVFFDQATPFAGLKPEIEQGYLSIWQDMRSKPEDLIAFAKTNGFEVDPKVVRASYASRAKTGRPQNSINYLQPPRVLTDKGDGAFGAAGRGFADPINMLDEMGAVADTFAPGSDRENVWSSDRRFGDIYQNNLSQNRDILAFDDAKHPYARFGGQLVGGIALPGASVEGVGLAAARAAMRGGASRFAAEQVARNAVTGRLGVAGAIEGGLAGAGQGEDWTGRAAGAAIGGPLGFGLGVGTGVAAPVLARAVGRPFSKLVGREGERTASDFTDGAVDTARAGAENDLVQPRARTGAPLPGDALTSAYRARMGQPNESAAMRSEVEQPSIHADDPTVYANDPIIEPSSGSDRTVDRIDVNARARPMMDPATEMERRAAADRLNPSDVLPLPANTVDGIDEAERIARSRFEDVRAPNERDALDPRLIPNANTGTPIPKRGPLDLVTWLRSQGGIRAQGGELEHAGIDNAGRKMDFAEGEKRFGPLVSNTGMGYDDAAHRAWEAGFFPDRSEPPTPAEFIDALRDTHTGQNRAFRPDDYEEVANFDAARQQRYDVEAAREAGAPLTSDRGQPVGLDDLDANAPPVRAYEEWGENAPNLAGNIRLDKLDSPEAIKRALVQTEKVTGGFDAARRGRITQAETKSLAADLGMTADDLLRRRKGQAFNAEQALAARQILARSATDLVNAAKRIARVQNPGDELEAAFREVWLRHAAIQEQVSGMTAEAGRLLQQFRMTADSRDAGQVLSSLGDSLGGGVRLRDVAGRIVQLEAAGTTPGGINRFALKAISPTWKDKATELYINSLLSGPQTHAVNILSNTLTSLAQIPEHAAGAVVGSVRRLLPNQADTDRVLFSEVGARAAGMVSGAREGMRAAARAFLTGDSADAINKVENQQMRAIPGVAGSVIRTPTRLLSAEDELFKGMASRMEMNGLAIRQAKSEGLRGKAARDRAADLVLNPTDDMLKRSFDYARYLTFQTPLEHGSFAAGVSSATQRRQELKLLLPFVRTPMNLLKFAAERSPAAPIMRSWRREVEAGGARRDMALARMAVGTGVAAAMYEMAAAGHITGGGPADQAKRRLMLANGWEPYSLKVGDRYYSYARLDPFSTTIGTAADLYDLTDNTSDDEKDGSAMMLAAAILNNLSSKTWLSGLSSALEAVNDPGRYLSNFLARTAGAIAVPALVAQTARETDPIIREARSPLDRIRSRVPGLSDDLYPRRDVLGRVVQSEGGIGPDMASPIWTSTARNDPTLRGLIDAEVSIAPPNRKYTAAGKSVAWTPAEYDQLQQATGELAKPQLDALVRDRYWRNLSNDSRQDEVRKIMKHARDGAKARVRSKLFGAPMTGASATAVN